MSLKSKFALVIFAALFACTQKADDKSPVKVLESYIQISFSVASAEDKHKMEELLTGDTRNRLTAWSDQQFLKAFVETKKKFQGLKILENKKISETENAITYQLSYEEGENDKRAQVTQRKLCTVIQEDGVWRIKEVRSLRESIEYLKELSLP
jgi:hypothetical protein